MNLWSTKLGSAAAVSPWLMSTELVSVEAQLWSTGTSAISNKQPRIENNADANFEIEIAELSPQWNEAIKGDSNSENGAEQ